MYIRLLVLSLLAVVCQPARADLQLRRSPLYAFATLNSVVVKTVWDDRYFGFEACRVDLAATRTKAELFARLQAPETVCASISEFKLSEMSEIEKREVDLEFNKALSRELSRRPASNLLPASVLMGAGLTMSVAFKPNMPGFAVGLSLIVAGTGLAIWEFTRPLVVIEDTLDPFNGKLKQNGLERFGLSPSELNNLIRDAIEEATSTVFGRYHA